MRTENHMHIRHVMLHHFIKEMSPAESFREINELYGKGTISQSQVNRWYKRFMSGDDSLEDEKRRGRPSTFDDQALVAAVKGSGTVTTRTLAKDFNVSHSTIVRRLKKNKLSPGDIRPAVAKKSH